MTKKDYIKIAATIRDMPMLGAKLQIAKCFADMLTQDNERFDRDRFIDAVMKP